MATGHRVHDKDILDALESIGTETYDARVWRIARAGVDPLRGSSSNGRWSSAGYFDVIYTSEARDGALAEIGYRLGLEPVWPSKIEHEIHEIRLRARQALRIPTLEQLGELGVDISRYSHFEYGRTQAIAGAANFLGYDALIVPSARHSCLNVVSLLGNLDHDIAPEILASSKVDWKSWRR